MRARLHENYGRGEYELSEEDQLYSPDVLTEHLRTTFESPSYDPPMLPAIALELMELTRRPNVSMSQVLELLERDPVLTAKVLRVAQSALYSNGGRFASLGEALTRLGLRTVEEIFLQTALSAKIFRAPGFEEAMEKIRLHSVVVGGIAREVCRLTALPDEYAFLCGLLHDVGMAAGVLILARHTQPSSGPRRKGLGKPSRRKPTFEELAPALVAVHDEASGVLAQAWKLPPDVQLVLRHHHAFEIQGRVHPLAAAVCIADWLSFEVGAGLALETNDMRARAAANHLQLNQQSLERLLQKSAQLAEHA